MRVNAADLRYRLKSILEVLDSNETVTILYHGKEKGMIIPMGSSPNKLSVFQHPFFGMKADDKSGSVESTMEELRRNRY
ncbi:MAG: type II toxin-antitoxin system Phd/YefM family antitoxin [Candidatus Omnitrophota bacterium]